MKEKNRTSIICAVVPAVIALVGTLIAGGKGASVIINNNIKTATGNINSVDSLIKQYEKVIDEKSKLTDDYESVIAENTELKGKLIHDTSADIKSPTVVIDGMKSDQNWNKSVAQISNMAYYSENMVNSLIEGKISYDMDQNALYYNKTKEDINSVTKVDAISTNVIYEGTNYDVVKESDGKDILMGAQSYSQGVVIWDDESLFGEGTGYALFDLQGKYSKIEFDVGRTNDYEKENVDLKVYLDSACKNTYQLDAETPLTHYEVDLNYANSMKLEISGGTRVKYGFVNVILYY